ncbi:MAG: UDP-2,4-diacetamido-2,4,6-trideoxy-beta-L-altropyranose hydrolase [Lentisphaerae bacterium]|nr:UDP-2,4-diacetamido-2,4,6-trideoxy-beta-L-altropyranose hydrolase [Lentisphaerota bacterium]
MQAAFRVDASAAIGSGHLMRGLVLADALRRRKVQSLFLCRGGPDHPGDVLAEHGHAVHLLPPLDNPLDDAVATAAHLDSRIDWLIVDHYALDHRWESPLRHRARRLMIIDDLANRRHDGDILLDPNLLPDMNERYDRLLPPSCRRLLGPSFALLRREFAEAAAAPPRTRDHLKRLLISFGGSDPGNATGRVLHEITPLPLDADVVAGQACPHLDDIQNLCRASNGRWTLHVQTRQMASLMARCDLALGAGGSSHWERCTMGLPALVTAIADNQILSSRALAEAGACRYLGESHSIPPGAWRRALQTLMDDPAPLAAMSRAARSIVPDANGADRVADILIQEASP